MKKKILLLVAMFVILDSTLLFDDCLCQWGPDVRLTNAGGNSITSFSTAWCISVNGNAVHVVWYDYRDGNYEIYYKRSTDGGINWGADTRLTNDTANSWHPSIAVSGSLVHVVWYDERDNNQEIYYKRSTDGGINWGADTRLTNDAANSWLPSMAVSGSSINIIWIDNRDGNYEIYYKRSTDGGINWGADTRLTNDNSSSIYPSIAVSGSFVHIVWDDSRDGNFEIYYKRSTDGGINWGADTRLTNDVADSYIPCIAVVGSFVNVVWADSRDINYEIYYKSSTDGGINWGVDTRLTNYIANSECPSIAVSQSLVHVAWFDFRDGNLEIYYKRSTDGGINWGADTRLTNDTANSAYPSIAISGSRVHVVWQDKRDGNWEVYYKCNPTGNVSIKNISTEIPSTFSLKQNYPNPFNPITNIKFDIPKNVYVTLKICNILGKEITTIVNKNLNAGIYLVDWNAGDYPSGVYFYRLETPDFADTKRMVLIK